MIYVAAAGWAVALVALAFAGKCYRELYKWARQCQNARIAIAFKRKVQLQAPLVEWLLWCNQLDKDKDSHGRVVYRAGGVSVAITKAATQAGRFHKVIGRAKPQSGTSAMCTRTGTYTATDQTPKQGVGNG